MSYRAATSITPVGENRWSARFAEGWDILENTNGGYMMAIASRASAAAADDRVPVSVTGHFTRPGHTGPAEVTTEVVRSGRRLSVVRATVTQEGKTVLETLGTFAEPPDAMPEIMLSDATPASLPPPDECMRAEPAADAPFPPPFMGQVDVRVDPGLARLFEGRPQGQAKILGWFRLKDDETYDPHSLIMISDAFPPTAFNAGLPIGWTPTLALTVDIRIPDVQGWIKCEIRSRFITGGFIEEDGLYWDESDRLVAQSRQLALVSTT